MKYRSVRYRMWICSLLVLSIIFLWVSGSQSAKAQDGYFFTLTGSYLCFNPNDIPIENK